jgi:hypothetical protein
MVLVQQIGTVFASAKYVAPMAVGVDIGCGMCAVPFDGLYKDSLSKKELRKIQQLIKERIPTGLLHLHMLLPFIANMAPCLSHLWCLWS